MSQNPESSLDQHFNKSVGTEYPPECRFGTHSPSQKSIANWNPARDFDLNDKMDELLK